MRTCGHGYEKEISREKTEFPLIATQINAIKTNYVKVKIGNSQQNNIKPGGGPRGVMVKVIDCGIVISEFELQLRYYVPFRTNTLGKAMG